MLLLPGHLRMLVKDRSLLFTCGILPVANNLQDLACKLEDLLRVGIARQAECADCDRGIASINLTTANREARTLSPLQQAFRSTHSSTVQDAPAVCSVCALHSFVHPEGIYYIDV